MHTDYEINKAALKCQNSQVYSMFRTHEWIQMWTTGGMRYTSQLKAAGERKMFLLVTQLRTARATVQEVFN